jgi:polysaccharide pyruvyl transferase WcaK-like protein
MTTAPRVGLYGLFGAGNSGNEASMQAMLAYLRSAHPEAAVDALTGGFRHVRDQYGLPARPINWYERFEGRPLGFLALPLRVAGKLADPFRLLAWVRRHDVIIVPGVGMFETTLPVHAYGFPLSTFLLTAFARVSGVKVALVSVGADFIGKRVTRKLSNGMARLVYYRSFRDSYSRDVMRQRGIDTSGDQVFPDLVFSIPVPPYDPGDPELVGVGVMDYYGSNDDRARSGEIHAGYVSAMTQFVRWLLGHGYRVRLFGGDSRADHDIAEQILAAAMVDSGDDGAPRVSAAPMSSYAEMLTDMNQVGMVVATRYHNVMCALKLSKPTISVGYSRKFAALMEGMGVGEYTQLARELDVDLLIKQFLEVQSRRDAVVADLTAHNKANAAGLARQFALLSKTLLS